MLRAFKERVIALKGELESLRLGDGLTALQSTPREPPRVLPGDPRLFGDILVVDMRNPGEVLVRRKSKLGLVHVPPEGGDLDAVV